jgi:hypothetical protein
MEVVVTVFRLQQLQTSRLDIDQREFDSRHEELHRMRYTRFLDPEQLQAEQDHEPRPNFFLANSRS